MKNKKLLSMFLLSMMALSGCNIISPSSTSKTSSTGGSNSSTNSSSVIVSPGETSSSDLSSSESSSSSSSSEKEKAKVEITSTVTSLRVGTTIELSASITGSEDPVVWSSENNSIATVDANGIVSGVNVGTVMIAATLSTDSTIKATVEITVLEALPTAVTIQNKVESAYIDDEVQLEFAITPEAAADDVEWSSSNEAVATVDANGLLTCVAKGETTITLKSTLVEEVKDEFVIKVMSKDFVLDKQGYSANVDYSHMNDEEEPYLKTNAVFEGDNPHAFAMFNVKGQDYYAEATISMINSTNDGWARFGIGSATDDTDGAARAFFFSPKEGQKTVMMDVPNGWGAVTAQSMIWQANGIKNMDPSNIKLGILRDGNEYYYLINDQLYWYEINNRFEGTDTYPTIITKDAEVYIMDWSYTVSEEELTAKKELDTMDKVFFDAGESEDCVNYVSDSEFSFNDMGGGSPSYFQNQCVKPLGDKGLLSGNFELEFDLSDVKGVNNDNNTRVGVALRYAAIESPYKADTFGMTHVTNDDGSTNGANTYDYRRFEWSDGGHTYWDAKGNTTSSMGTEVNGHYKLVRTVDGNTNTLELYFEGEKVLTATNDYVGDYHILFGANIASGKVSNASWTNK